MQSRTAAAKTSTATASARATHTISEQSITTAAASVTEFVRFRHALQQRYWHEYGQPEFRHAGRWSDNDIDSVDYFQHFPFCFSWDTRRQRLHVSLWAFYSTAALITTGWTNYVYYQAWAGVMAQKAQCKNSVAFGVWIFGGDDNLTPCPKDFINRQRLLHKITDNDDDRSHSLRGYWKCLPPKLIYMFIDSHGCFVADFQPMCSVVVLQNSCLVTEVFVICCTRCIWRFMRHAHCS